MPIEIPKQYEKVYDAICRSYRELEGALHWEEMELPDVETVVETAEALEKRLFTLVFMGGFNTGKSSLINILFQREVYKREEDKTEAEKELHILCKEGATPTTAKIHILKYGEKERERLDGEFVLEQWVPNPLMKKLHIEIVDTPGTDSTNEMHDELTQSYIPRADLVFFTFSVDQAFKRSEVDFLRLIYENWKREIIYILNKVDIRRDPDGNIDWKAIETVEKDIQSQSQKIFEREFPLFKLSAQLVREGVRKQSDQLLRQSQIHKLESYINDQLKDILHQIKLTSALRTAIRVCEKVIEKIEEEIDIILAFHESLDMVKKFVISYWDLNLRGEEGAYFTERHAAFKRFEKLEEKLHRQIDKIFNLPQLMVVLFKGGKDELVKSFKSELGGVAKDFKNSIRGDLESLVENFEREFQLHIREQEVTEQLEKAQEHLEELRGQLTEQLSTVVEVFHDQEMDGMLDNLGKRMVVALTGWLVGVVTILGSLGSIASNPLGALVGGGLIGGGLIGGGMVWYTVKKNKIKGKFSEEVKKLKRNFRAKITSKIESEIIDDYLNSYQLACEEKVEKLEAKEEEFGEIKKVFEGHQKTLEKLGGKAEESL